MIVLTILKVIGIVLLVFLLLIFLVLGILLFVPVRYRSNSYKNETSDYQIRFDAYWLLKALRFNALYDPQGLKLKLKLFWFTLIDTDKSSEDTGDSDDSDASDDPVVSYEESITEVSTKEAAEGSLDTTTMISPREVKGSLDTTTMISPREVKGSLDDSTISTEADNASIDNSATISTEKPDEISDSDITNKPIPNHSSSIDEAAHASSDSKTDISSESSATTSSESKTYSTSASDTFSSSECESYTSSGSTPEENSKPKSRNSIFEKFKEIYNTVLGKILDAVKKVCMLKEKITDPDNKIAFRLLIENIKYLLRHYRFRVFKGNLTYGSDDPYSVGQVMTYLSLFYPLFGDRFTVNPVFDRPIFTGNVYFKGHIRLIHLLLSVISLMKNKTIRRAVVNHFKEDTNG